MIPLFPETTHQPSCIYQPSVSSSSLENVRLRRTPKEGEDALRKLVDSMREAVFTVSPKRQ